MFPPLTRFEAFSQGMFRWTRLFQVSRTRVFWSTKLPGSVFEVGGSISRPPVFLPNSVSANMNSRCGWLPLVA